MIALWSLQLNIGRLILDPWSNQFVVLYNQSIARGQQAQGRPNGRRRPAFLYLQSSSSVPLREGRVRHSIRGGVFYPAHHPTTAGVNSAGPNRTAPLATFLFLTDNLELCCDDTAPVRTVEKDALTEQLDSTALDNFGNIFGGAENTFNTPATSSDSNHTVGLGWAAALAQLQQASHVAPSVDKLLPFFLSALLPLKFPPTIVVQSGVHPTNSFTPSRTMEPPVDSITHFSTPTPYLLAALATHPATLDAPQWGCHYEKPVDRVWNGSALFAGIDALNNLSLATTAIATSASITNSANIEMSVKATVKTPKKK
jgi:hypothetical protein